MSADPYDLERFVAAQSPIYEQALSELRAGCKRSHWMWFIIPFRQTHSFLLKQEQS